MIRRRSNSECYRRAQSRAIILISLALGTAIVIAAVAKKSLDRNPDADSQPTSQPTTIPARASVFTIDATDDFNFTMSFDGEPILHMIDGHRVRFRCNPRNDHWVGTKQHPVHIAWSPWDASKVADLNVTSVIHDNGFDLTITGRKPQIDNVEFTTTLTGRQRFLPDGHGRHDSIEYKLRSTLHARPSQVKRALASGTIEYLDPWIEGIFWPEREGRDREIYDYFVFGDRAGMQHAPKLHLFPSLRDATYETLTADLDAGFLGFIDLDEPDLYFRILNLSGSGQVGICWWTWDPHFHLTLDDNSEAPPSFEMMIDEIPASITPGVMLEPTNVRIPFETDPDYQIPSFQLDGVNRFDDMLDQSHEWGWEPHSRACTLDTTIGFDDKVCATITGRSGLTTAWYARTLGSDYFDHKPLVGGRSVSAMIKTEGVTQSARLGIICYNGPETWLYEEPEPVAIWSEPVNGTTDWQPVSIRFDGTGYKRFKLVLEQTGPGQSWFDNVEIRHDNSADGIGWHDKVVDWNNRDWSKPQALPRQAMKCSQPQMLEDPSRLVMAWSDCSATSPLLHLPEGKFRLIVRAIGDGCETDQPQLEIKLADDAFNWTIGLDDIQTYTREFDADGDQPISFSLKFINDGPCDQKSQTMDKNVFIHDFSIQRMN